MHWSENVEFVFLEHAEIQGLFYVSFIISKLQDHNHLQRRIGQKLRNRTQYLKYYISSHHEKTINRTDRDEWPCTSKTMITCVGQDDNLWVKMKRIDQLNECGIIWCLSPHDIRFVMIRDRGTRTVRNGGGRCMAKDTVWRRTVGGSRRLKSPNSGRMRTLDKPPPGPFVSLKDGCGRGINFWFFLSSISLIYSNISLNMIT